MVKASQMMLELGGDYTGCGWWDKQLREVAIWGHGVMGYSDRAVGWLVLWWASALGLIQW